MHHLSFLRLLTDEYNKTEDEDEKKRICKELVEHLTELNGGHCDECAWGLTNKQELVAPWCSIFHRSMPPNGYCHNFKQRDL